MSDNAPDQSSELEDKVGVAMAGRSRDDVAVDAFQPARGEIVQFSAPMVCKRRSAV
jgi:hypothetical protein